jgi:hypothetical protein
LKIQFIDFSTWNDFNQGGNGEFSRLAILPKSIKNPWNPGNPAKIPEILEIQMQSQKSWKYKCNPRNPGNTNAIPEIQHKSWIYVGFQDPKIHHFLLENGGVEIQTKSKCLLVVTDQETMGYDSYPVIRERLTDPSSGTVPDTTVVSKHRIRSREWSGNGWKRLETGSGNDDGILLRECVGISWDPAGSCRTSLTWEY